MRLHFASSALLTSALVFASLAIAPTAQANELDNEASVTNQQIELARELPATVVVRVSESDGKVEVLHSNEKLAATPESVRAVSALEFNAMDVTASQVGELDRESSRSSWYFYFNGANWNYPTYSYAGYSYGYSPYWGYSWGGYSYWYCRWNYGWWY